MDRMGYRQKAIIAKLAAVSGDVPTGYLVRACGVDPKTAYMALLGLERRGLVVHVRHGRWAAA